MVFLDNICLIMAFPQLFSLSNKLTPEPKSKMAETSQLSDYSSQFPTTLAAVTNYSTAHVQVIAS